jgi:hypothetical protein
MRPVSRFYGWVERRVAKRTLVRAVVVPSVVVVLLGVSLGWYSGTTGLALRQTAYDEADRTVVIDHADHERFARRYTPRHETGWCLYGAANDTHVRVADVVRATPVSGDRDRIEFTCLPETVGQLVQGRPAGFLGVAHSHVDVERSRPSHVDAMTWGRLGPLVQVMGVYSRPGGIEFFTQRSVLHPLETEVVGAPAHGGNRSQGHADGAGDSLRSG